jgi:glycine cleavage system regulatory protein
MTSLVLTLLGPDRPGLVEAVADVIAAHGGNWLESRMAHLAGKFAGVLRADVPADKLEAALQALSRLETRGLKIVAEKAVARDTVTGQRAMRLELVGLDRPGIVREISQLLAQQGVNVEELTTDRSSAPMSGEMLFHARARVNIPGDADLARLRNGLERLANDLVVEIRLAESAHPDHTGQRE